MHRPRSPRSSPRRRRCIISAAMGTRTCALSLRSPLNQLRCSRMARRTPSPTWRFGRILRSGSCERSSRACPISKAGSSRSFTSSALGSFIPHRCGGAPAR
eukprot:6026537-Prymnesium_polylepis.1